MLREVINKTIYTSIEYYLQIVLGVFFLSVIYFLMVRPFFASPLKNIPGPYWNRVSIFPSLNSQRTHKWIETVYNLHLKYGTVVVLSPYEISVNGSSQYIKDIYVKNFCKGKFYDNFRNHGHDNPFSELKNDVHLKYKKILMNTYNKTSILSPQNPTRSHLVSTVLKVLGRVRKEQELNKNGAIDVYSLFSCLAMDVILAFELGKDSGTNLLEHLESEEVVHWYRKKDSMGFWTTLMPRFWNLAATKEIKKAVNSIEQWHMNLYSHAEKNMNEEKQSYCPSLKVLQLNGFHDKNAYSFITDNIFAGHRTTAIQLTYLCYEISRPVNRKWQDILKKELVEHFDEPLNNESIIQDFEIVDKLPVLNALLQENLRVHSSIPGAHPRVVDRKYTVEVQKVDKILKVLIPQGTIISCLPYAMHRQEEIFPSPDKFKPERWLPYKEENDADFKARISNQQRFMMPFGKGIRLCLGMNLAILEIKFTLANLYWHSRSEISDKWCKIENKTLGGCPIKLGLISQGMNCTDEEKMVMVDSYTTRPLNDECWLSFYFRNN